MAKRFTDTAKWDRQWFRKLSPKMKCAWTYLCDRCDHAGVWEPDFDLMSYYIAESITEKEFEEAFSGRVLKLSGSQKYLLLGYVSFQYISLKKGSRTHESVINILRAFAPHICPKSLELYPKPFVTLSEPLVNPSVTASEINETLSGISEGLKGTGTGKFKGTDTGTEPEPLQQSSLQNFKTPKFSLGVIA